MAVTAKPDSLQPPCPALGKAAGTRTDPSQLAPGSDGHKKAAVVQSQDSSWKLVLLNCCSMTLGKKETVS